MASMEIVLTYQKLQTTTATSKPTWITKEILILIEIDSPTTTPTQELIITAYNGCTKTVIGNSMKIRTNTTTSITTRLNSILTALINLLKWII